MFQFTANYWPATQTNQYYRYATHTNINYSYATLPIEPFTVTSLILVILALTLYNRFNTIILTKSYHLSQSQSWSASVRSSSWSRLPAKLLVDIYLIRANHIKYISQIKPVIYLYVAILSANSEFKH